MALRSRTTVLAVVAGSALASAAAFLPVSSAQGAPVPLTIGVDHSTPSGHNFQYVDYFPRSGVKVHTGDVVAFKWAAGPDGFHTVTLLKTGQTPQQAWQSTPAAVPDSDDGTGKFQFNPAIGAPTNPPPGSGAPTACGDSATPCTTDGSSLLNSGARPTNGTTSFWVKINAAAGTNLNFVCLVHPGMAGSLQVVPTATAASTPSQVAAAAATQASQDTTGAATAEANVGPATSTVTASGHRTFNAVAGTATQYVEVAEFLPGKLAVGAGDAVTWVTKTIRDIHTVTFPSGTHSADPIPQVCEGAGATDTPATGGPPSCPGGPSNFEVHFVAGPFGTHSISSASQVASSGLLATAPAPFPSDVTYTFPTAGTFNFFCHIHENAMKGSVVVQAAAAVATPVTTQPKFTG